MYYVYRVLVNEWMTWRFHVHETSDETESKVKQFDLLTTLSSTNAGKLPYSLGKIVLLAEITDVHFKTLTLLNKIPFT